MEVVCPSEMSKQSTQHGVKAWKTTDVWKTTAVKATNIRTVGVLSVHCQDIHSEDGSCRVLFTGLYAVYMITLHFIHDKESSTEKLHITSVSTKCQWNPKPEVLLDDKALCSHITTNPTCYYTTVTSSGRNQHSFACIHVSATSRDIRVWSEQIIPGFYFLLSEQHLTSVPHNYIQVTPTHLDTTADHSRNHLYKPCSWTGQTQNAIVLDSRHPSDRFSWNFIFGFLTIICWYIPVLVKIRQHSEEDLHTFTWLVLVTETDCVNYEVWAGAKETVTNQNTIESKFDAKICRKITGTITGHTCQTCYALQSLPNLLKCHTAASLEANGSHHIKTGL
jgi:hypothetical protein